MNGTHTDTAMLLYVIVCNSIIVTETLQPYYYKLSKLRTIMRCIARVTAESTASWEYLYEKDDDTLFML